jgi:hypothetical protein
MALTGSLYSPEPRVMLNGEIGNMKFSYFSVTVRDARELRDELTRILEEVETVDQAS